MTTEESLPSKSPQETDTCRICRGEGSAEEPLFHPCKCSGSIMYVHQTILVDVHDAAATFARMEEGSAEEPLFHPCKCSGSIMYVHQDCLMEWLSHSQKKHCELCKTSFTFTKLYRSDMPPVLPTAIFLQKAAMHVVSKLLYWARGALVALTWLFWLPWTMRFVWWGLFFLADMAWTHKVEFLDGGIVETRSNISVIAKVSDEGGVIGFLGWLFALPNDEQFNQTSLSVDINSNMTASLARVRSRATLLSGVPFFKNAALDRIATDVLEGLIITIALVAAIVLVLLIREWVVQQQPIINMGVDEVGPNPQPQAARIDNIPTADEPEEPDQREANSAPSPDNGTPAGVQVDGSLTRWENVDSLLATVRDTGTNGALKQFRRGDLHLPFAQDSSGPEYEVKHRMGALLIRIHETHVALVQEFEQAEVERDYAVMQITLTKVKDLEVVLDYLSDSERDALSPLLRGTKQRIGNALDQARPSMPSRDDSFIANEIQRQLQESSAMGHSQSDSSGNSARSWQEVDRPESNSDSNFRAETAPAEGFARESTPSESPAPGSPVPETLASQAPLELPTEEATDAPIDIPPATHPTELQPWYMKVVDWLWGDIAPQAPQNENHQNNEQVVADLEDEQPLLRPEEHEHENIPEEQALGRPALVPNEAELAEEAEDLEGVMELIGMQGPLTGLFTNAIFAAVFVSCTTTLSIWLPFLLGKVVLVWIAHPILLGEAVFKGASATVNVLLDLCILGVAYGAQWVLNIPLNWVSAWQGFTNDRYATPVIGPLATWTIQILHDSYGRIAAEITNAVQSTGAASSHLTLDSHAALGHIKMQTSNTLNETVVGMLKLRQHVSDSNGVTVSDMLSALLYGIRKVSTLASALNRTIKGLPKFLVSGQLTISHTSGPTEMTEPPIWTALDRSLTITIGYAALVAFAVFYYSRLAPLATSREVRKIENTVLEILQQTGGVAKVVLIISIEMLVFPLYCGLLLDIAMLPLFGSASIESRLNFTMGSPWTSLFVHWFIGTCYMFHFALFVAMCRKILRKGVLYFIRDPDDPTFHPVRDVLERSVISQLRKLVTSAMLYGCLVTVCLGSILWLLAHGISGILPIRWSSDNNYLGFPVDLLLYTSLKPLLVRYLTPSDWLHKMYEWWCRRSARVLCLSHYLFGEDNQDEHRADKGIMAGRWMRVPGNDQVRIGRGRQAWIDVNERNHRQDGVHEPTDVEGVGPNDSNFAKVYIPPYFRLRIALFFASLWALTASAILLLTVLPLLCGRSLFALMLPRDLWANDIYAFTVGLIAMCAVAFVAIKSRNSVPSLSIENAWHVLTSAWGEYAATMSVRTRKALRCVYVYGVAAFVMPCVVALLSEVYLLAPLHTSMTDGKEPHTIQLFRSWTLGVQYVRIFISIVQWNPESKPARALRAIVARGYLDPDAGKATRYFYLPVTAIALVAMTVPLPLGALAAGIFCDTRDEAKQRLYRSMAYPILFNAAASIIFMRWALSLLHGWRMRIRDETYLIGERLHNYGETNSAPHTKIFRREIM